MTRTLRKRAQQLRVSELCFGTIQLIVITVIDMPTSRVSETFNMQPETNGGSIWDGV